MKTLYSYLIRQVLVMLVMAVLICTFVLLLGNILKDIVGLLLSGQASLGLLAQGFGLLVPYLLAFALPVGLLAATLLTFGRMSADNELTAIRASGVGLFSLILPLLGLSLALSLLCAYVNMEVAPRCRVAYKSLMIQFGVKQSLTFLQENRYNEFRGGVTVYLRKRDGNELKDVRFYQYQNNDLILHASADRGEIVLDLTNKNLSLRLFDAIIEQRLSREAEVQTNGVPVSVPFDESRTVDWQPVKGDFETPTFALENVLTSAREPKLSEMTFSQLRRKIAQLQRQGIPTMPAEIQLHRQVAFSFASFAFTLIGIPLGIRAHRRETMVGVGLALLLLIGYYSFFIMGEALQSRPELFPQTLLWAPNFLFQGLGAWLLWRANRGI